MNEWPPIEDPELLARLALSDDDFAEAFEGFARKFLAELGPRAYDEDVYQNALGYPWARPGHSFLWRDGTVTALDEEIIPALGGCAWGAASLGSEPRYPLLAIGANGAPEALSRKLEERPADDRTVLVVAGDLHDYDVGPCAVIAHYGAMPATVFHSPGTAVRAAVLWVTIGQLTRLTVTELGYHLGRLDGIRFDADQPGMPPVDSALVYVARSGHYCHGGRPLALAALPARNRSARPMTQEELLQPIAQAIIGPQATPRDFVELMTHDPLSLIHVLRPMLAADAQFMSQEHWTPFTQTR